MEHLKTQLLQELQSIAYLQARPAPVAGGTALFYRDKEFAHFHHANELDMRLGKATIRALGLTHPADSTVHPQRSKNSPWIELRFTQASDVERIKRLVEVAIAGLQT